MSGILDLLQGNTGKELINGISKETNTSESQVASVVKMALPMLLGAMQKNAESPEGAAGLLNALKGNKHDGSLLSNLGGLFNGGFSSDTLKDGSGILGHLLGNKTSTVENAISNRTGVSSSTIAKILPMLAPIVMSFLGKKVTDEKVDSTSGLGSLLSGVLGSDKGGSMLTSLLDSDGDGSVMDDIAGMFLGGKKKDTKEGGGLLDSLGGLF